VAVERALPDGALATLLGTAVEAKTATLRATTGFSGTTTDAVAVGCDPSGEPAEFAGSATAVGAAARVCVRDAVLASLDTAVDDPPASVAEADHGVVTGGTAGVFRL
jgi:adenosylcobinamide hydrolase